MSVIDEAFDHLVGTGVADPVVDLVLAAVEGVEALEAALDGGVVERPATVEASQPDRPASVYLSDITVSGFRGVGPESTISFVPGPGLTVVVGRNGSGKSSFFDALEVALTGDSYRWKEKPAEWKAGWRNLHQPDGASVVAHFQTEGMAGPTTVHRSWADGGKKVDDATTWAQHHGMPRSDLDGLGWSAPVTLYRPLLATAEVGAIASQSPSQLFDALSGVLGLEEMSGAAETIRQARLRREKLDKTAKDDLKNRILPLLGGLDDDRASACAAALSAKSWDLETMAGIVTGGGPAPNPALGALANFAVPSAEQVEALASRLEAVSARVSGLESGDSAQASRLVELLATALDHHAGHGNTACPVCGTGTLDAEWQHKAQLQVEGLREQAKQFIDAVSELNAAISDAKRLTAVGPLPADSPIDLGALRQAVSDFSRLPDDPTEKAVHLRSTHPLLVEAASRVIEAAQQAFSAAEEAWRPVATSVAHWVGQAQEALTARSQVDRLKQAETAAKDAGAALRAKRFAPIATQAVSLWEALRLQSNVELASIELSGAGMSRRVDLDVRVDGTDGAALGVVSQGEINCLALSLFFPRATLPESPFRFMVIDDPVQAMDPARVDGLARVFCDMAADRQVVVFTHDDRLPESLRRLGLAHTAKEVTRRPGSVVAVREVLDPVSQYFRDAWAVAKDEQLPDGVASRVVPGMCRLGLEAAFTEKARKRLHGAGHPHASVESTIAAARKLTDIAALAMFGDIAEGKRVLPTLDGIDRTFANVFRDCNEGAHRGFGGSLPDLVNTARSLAARARA